MASDWASFLSGTALLIVGAAVMWVYRPRRGWCCTPSGVLGMAIFLGFFAAVTNTLYWQVWGQLAAEFWGIITVYHLREVGKWVDLIVKGGAAIAGVLHLWAIKLQRDQA